MACSNYWTMNGRIIIQVLTLLSEAYESGNQAVRTAAQAATSQTLRSFCNFLGKLFFTFSAWFLFNCLNVQRTKARNSTKLSQVLVSHQLEFPVSMKSFLYSSLFAAEWKKFKGNFVLPSKRTGLLKVVFSAPTGRSCSGVVFLLECLHTLISSLPQQTHTNKHFTTFLWQKFCPSLIAFLGSPRVDKNIVSSNKTEGEMGRGSGCLASALSFDSHEAKTVYRFAYIMPKNGSFVYNGEFSSSIGTQLVRLVGCVGSLRPVLESVFHRMLLYPPPQHRLEALQALREVINLTVLYWAASKKKNL